MADEAYDDDYADDDFEDYTSNPPTPPVATPPPPIYAPAPAPQPPSPLSPDHLPRSPAAPPWELITLEELEMDAQLARGAMGAVHAATWRGRAVAAKTLHDTSAAQLASVEAELLVHASLRHARVVELLGANLCAPGCCIVMERCDCSLFERLHRRRGEFHRRDAMGVALQVAEGMAFLHSRRPAVVHRDLKSHNVLLDARGDAKLCDFGLVNTREVTAGTPNYMAPELFLSKPYSTPVDVFAFGVLLNEMWAREVPWDGYAPMDIKAKVTDGERPAKSSTMPMQCETLLRKLWHQTASLRPSFEEVALPLERVMETLPGRASSSNSIGGMGGGMDALDALDSLAGLSLKPQRR